MNWKQIKKDYPKSWDRLESWFNSSEPLEIGKSFLWSWTKSGNSSIREKVSIRDLYSFFDEQGLVIFLKQGTLDGWLDFDIENRNKDFNKEERLLWDEVETDRKGIEIIAFTKAFEILENQ